MRQLRSNDCSTFASTQSRQVQSARKFGLLKSAGVVTVFCIVAAIVSPAQTTFTPLASFDATDGTNPYASLIQSIDGNFYGTSRFGTPNTKCGNGCGTAFKLTPEGALTVLYNFCSQKFCADGVNPGGLVQASNGNIYGITGGGGPRNHCRIIGGCGTVFTITPAGKVTTLYSFCSRANCTDGYIAWTVPGLIQGANGNLYGTTHGGGANGFGTVFEITPAGKLTTLYSFCSETNCKDGSYALASLVQGSDGNFYGTTNGGGAPTYCPTGGNLLCGTVFKITPAGKLTTIYRFCSLSNCSDGSLPFGALVQGRDGNFYGTTFYGGPIDACYQGCGTIFKVTPGGKLTTLYNFCTQTDCSDGLGPWAGLTSGTDGNFYGTTGYGGNPSNGGTVFKFTPAGALTTLYRFDNTDGSVPFAQLVQATNGTFYGTTTYGGDFSCNPSNGCGTAFSLGGGS